MDLVGRLLGSGDRNAFGDSRIAALVVSAVDEADGRYWDTDFGKSRAGIELLGESPERQAAAVVELLELASVGHEHVRYAAAVAQQLAQRLLKRNLPLTEAQLVAAWKAVLDMKHVSATYGPEVALIRATERRTPEPPVGRDLERVLRRVREHLLRHPSVDDRRAATRIDLLLGAEPAGPLGSDPWSVSIGRAIEAMPESDRKAAEAIVAAAAEHGRSSKITGKFLARREELIAELGAERLGELVGPLLSAAAGVPARGEQGQIPSEVGDLLRGLAVIAGRSAGSDTARALADLAIAGWRKIPGHGPACRKAATAAIAALAEHPDGAPHLGRVKIAVKQPAARDDVDGAIAAAAETLGIPRAEFEERVVPDMGFTDGSRSEALGSHVARVAFDDRRQLKLVFISEAGKELKSVPTEVKRDHAARLVALKAEVKDAQAMFDAQRLRIERLLMDDPAWDVESWQARYADHGLVGPLTRRLIWRFGDEAAAWHDGAWRDVDGTEVRPSGPVRLWHPADARATEVQAWRAALEDREVTQPFKQAHREVYLLTDAERQTRSYSNRFAAHVLRQHQMAALARGRGWTYALQGAWDSADEAVTLRLPQHGLVAFFFVDRPWDSEDYNDSGVFTHVLTDQVRFENAEGQPRDLEGIPRRILSEVLRDVDLFVGVASIGNDPAWQDRGAERRYDDYWTQYSFGELAAGAEIRRDVLDRLLPKLKIADRSTIDGRFLRVEGKLRTYKIHLGSGNILMEPNNEYLCIVPGGRDRSPGRLYLPFEGDQMLSIILSKAFMLAQDDAIDDPTIVGQIKR